MTRVVGSKNLFKGCDLQRAVRSAQAAGLTVARVEVDRAGKIAVVVGEPEFGNRQHQQSESMG